MTPEAADVVPCDAIEGTDGGTDAAGKSAAGATGIGASVEGPAGFDPAVSVAGASDLATA